MNEELQANFEELESDDADLQATNQNMETTLEELGVTSEMLETSNEELHVQVRELQEQIVLLSDERGRLAEIIEQARFSFVELRGPDLRVETISPDYARKLHGQKILAKSFSEVVWLIWAADVPMLSLANEVYQQDTQRNVPAVSTGVSETPDGRGERHPAYTLVPIHATDETVSGVIIYTIGESEEREQAARVDKPDVAP